MSGRGFWYIGSVFLLQFVLACSGMSSNSPTCVVAKGKIDFNNT